MMITLSLAIVRNEPTDGAILFTDGTRQEWIPRQCIESMEGPSSTDSELGDIYEVEIPEWLALDRGLI